MERHQRIQLKTTSRSIDQPFQVSPFQTRGFGVQQKAASTPASKAELWENYQRSTQMTQKGSYPSIQAKLTIGQPGDKYEQEADSVADRVMAMSEPAQVQREELGEEEEELQMKPLAGMISPLVQREELPEEEEELQMKPEDHVVQREELPEEEEELQMKSLDNSIQREALPEEEEELQMKPEDSAVQREALPEEEEEELQMKSLDNSIQREALPEEEEEIQTKQSSGSNVPVSTHSLEHRLSSSKGGGNPLSDDVRSFMEQRFGADFSGVRVHTGSDAVQMNQDVNAQAFAHGSDVYFGAGKAPGKDALTAHELTHVVQQTGAVQRGLLQRQESEKAKENIAKCDEYIIDSDWHNAVFLLNSFPIYEIKKQFVKHRLSGREFKLIHQAAILHPGGGPFSNIATVTKPIPGLSEIKTSEIEAKILASRFQDSIDQMVDELIALGKIDLKFINNKRIYFNDRPTLILGETSPRKDSDNKPMPSIINIEPKAFDGKDISLLYAVILHEYQHALQNMGDSHSTIHGQETSGEHSDQKEVEAHGRIIITAKESGLFDSPSRMIDIWGLLKGYWTKLSENGRKPVQSIFNEAKGMMQKALTKPEFDAL